MPTSRWSLTQDASSSCCCTSFTVVFLFTYQPNNNVTIHPPYTTISKNVDKVFHLIPSLNIKIQNRKMVRSHFLSTNTSRDPVSSKLRQTGRVVSSWGGEKRVERYRGRRRRRRRIVAGSLTSSTPFFRPMFASCIWLGNTKGLTYTYESSSPFLPPSLSPPHSQPARCGGRSWRRSSALSPGRRRAHTRKFLVPGENLVEQPRRGSKRYERCSLSRRSAKLHRAVFLIYTPCSISQNNPADPILPPVFLHPFPAVYFRRKHRNSDKVLPASFLASVTRFLSSDFNRLNDDRRRFSTSRCLLLLLLEALRSFERLEKFRGDS